MIVKAVITFFIGPDQPTPKQIRRQSLVGDVMVAVAFLSICYLLGVGQ